MFTMLRKMIGPIMLVVLVAFVATIIFSWGGGGFSDRPRDTVGVINGQDISIKVFDEYYTNLLRQAQRESDYNLPEGKTEEIRNNAWQQLQNDILMNDEIEKYGIVVTSEEIYSFLKLYPPQELQSAPQFMTDGNFDYQKYVNAMINPDNAPFWANLENYVLPDLKKYKLQEQIIGAVRVTPAEVMEAFLFEKEKIKLGYISIKNNDLRELISEATEEETQLHYDENKENYQVDERARIDFVLFKKEPSENDWQRIRFQIQDIYDSASAGADFTELAEIFSEDNSASNGGDLGWFKRGQMVPPFDSAVFSMEVGQVSQPVKTRFGYHVIKLLGIKEEERNAAHVLYKIEASQETLDQALQFANDFTITARENGFEQTAEEFNYEIKSSQRSFDKDGFIGPVLRTNSKISEFALSNKIDEISDPFELKDFIVVAKVTERIPAGYSTIDEVAINIRSDIKKEKSKQMALDTAGTIYESIKNGSSFNRASATFGFSYEATELINRNSVVPNVGRFPEVTGAGFALKEINQTSGPIAYKNGVVILKLLEKVSADLEEFNQIQDSLKMVTLQKKQQDMYRQWYTDLVNNAEIVSYLDDFYSSY